MTKNKGKGRGNRNPASYWGTGGTDAGSTTWNPSNDFVPAWISPNQLTSSDLSFDVELSGGQLQHYIPLYVNNDAVRDSTDVFILELDPNDSSVGFSQETYILQESWDEIAGDVPAFGIGGTYGPAFGRAFPEESDLSRMYLVNGPSRPLNTPKIVPGGRFSEATIIIEDAQSTTPPVRLDDNNNTYIVMDLVSGPGTDAVYAGAGNDQITGSNSRREYISRSTDQSLQFEQPIADHLFGEAGDDTLKGGLNDDLLNGGSGNDHLFGEGGEDDLDGMMGDDILWGDYEENYKDGNNLNGTSEVIVGERDILRGGSGNDALFGGAGADLLFGGDGIDYLSAGKKGTTTAHPQVLEGGAGADRFDFYTHPWLDDLELDVTFGSRAMEMISISDFNAAEGDKIGIYIGTSYSSSFRNAGLPVNAPINANQFHVGSEATDENDRFIYRLTDEAFYFDSDGTGVAPKIFLAFIENSSTLTAADIVTFDDSNRLPPSSTPLPPPPSVQFSQSSYRVSENAGTASITLSRTDWVKARSQVNLSITGETATRGSDYSGNGFPLTVTFDVNESNKTIEIPILQDNQTEVTESLSISISAFYDPNAGTIETPVGQMNTAILQILDDDQLFPVPSPIPVSIPNSIPVSTSTPSSTSTPNPIPTPTNNKDVLIGTPNADRIAGLGGGDILSGRESQDVLIGGAGNDTLYGGLGSDKMIGGKGRDFFVLERGAGRDQIMDFEDKRDRIGLLPGIQFKKLNIRSKGRNTLISLGKDQLAILKGIQADQITATDFKAVPFFPNI